MTAGGTAVSTSQESRTVGHVGSPHIASPPMPIGVTTEPAPLKSAGRLEAISRGETVAADIHAALADEAAVLEITEFNLWYAAKQALWDIQMNIPAGKVTSIIGPSSTRASPARRSIT